MTVHKKALPRISVAGKKEWGWRVVFFLFLLFMVESFGRAQQAMVSNLTRPVPERARRLVREGRQLVEHDEFMAAESKFRQAIKIAPQFVQAHFDLVYLKCYFLQEIAGTEDEYRELVRREPFNPLYPLVLAVSRLERIHDHSPEEKTDLLQRASDLVPDWPWAHYARARLYQQEGKHEEMVRELERFLEHEPQFSLGWSYLAGVLDRELGRWAEAEKAYRQIAKLSGAPVSLDVWRMRLKASGESDTAREHLRKELEGWQKRSLPPQYQMVVARAYRVLLNDDAAAQGIEDAVQRSHPNWARAQIGYDIGAPWTVRREIDGPERVLAGGRHAWLFVELRRSLEEKDPTRRIERIHSLLARNPIPALRWLMQRSLFEAQIEAEFWAAAKITLAELLASKPEVVEPRLRLALALADNKTDLEGALQLVQEAKELRRQFREWTRPKEFGLEEWKRYYASPEYQRRVYNNALAAIADAKGWVLAQQGKLEQAERELRAAVGLNPSPQAQYHLGVVLDRRGEIAEALDTLVKAASQESAYKEKARKAAELVFEKEHVAGVDALIERVQAGQVEARRERILNELIREPAKDFELTALDGRSYRLSALRNKVVLVNFWSKWCAPCVAEMPELARLYQDYREAGLEILAISVDTYEAEVKSFVDENALPFPVFIDTDNKVGPLYGVNGVPDTLFIDRAGDIRLRRLGRTGETVLQAVVEVLLEDQALKQ